MKAKCFFAEKVVFEEYLFRNMLLGYFGIEIEKFEKTYFAFIPEKSLHISESEFDYTWISNRGLVGHTKRSKNNFVNAFRSQYIVFSLLLDKALTLCEDENIYDIDTFNYEYLSDLTPALFQNALFFFELFGKEYLSLSNFEVQRTHKLSCILALCKDKMLELNHNNTLLNLQIFKVFETYVDYIESIPGGFKEQFAKCIDNNGDDTIVIFEMSVLKDVKNSIEMSYDFIEQYEYKVEDDDYLKDDLLQRLL